MLCLTVQMPFRHIVLKRAAYQNDTHIHTGHYSKHVYILLFVNIAGISFKLNLLCARNKVGFTINWCVWLNFRGDRRQIVILLLILFMCVCVCVYVCVFAGNTNSQRSFKLFEVARLYILIFCHILFFFFPSTSSFCRHLCCVCSTRQPLNWADKRVRFVSIQSNLKYNCSDFFFFSNATN